MNFRLENFPVGTYRIQILNGAVRILAIEIGDMRHEHVGGWTVTEARDIAKTMASAA